MQTKRIVVTGIGTLNPLGNNLSEYWDSLKQNLLVRLKVLMQPILWIAKKQESWIVFLKLL